ncbi:MAG: hypothetical protein IPG39_15325 [Bacteroidetes bacterium]|nr:hypothetical protein [Bacteroidota bacterium]
MIRPSGIFSIQQDFDSKYVLVPIDFARKIIGLPTKVSSVEVALKSGADAESVRDLAQQLLMTLKVQQDYSMSSVQNIEVPKNGQYILF